MLFSWGRVTDKLQVEDALLVGGTGAVGWGGGWGVGAGNKLHGEGDFLARITIALLYIIFKHCPAVYAALCLKVEMAVSQPVGQCGYN